MSEAESSQPRTMEARWRKRTGLLVGSGLVVVLLAMVFNECHQKAIRTVPSTDLAGTIADPKTGASASDLIDAVGPPARVTPVPPDSTRTAKNSRDGEESATARECKRAPIRGCAPGKDQQGCYHCTKCWRPFHYDIQNRVNTMSFACAQMPDAPLYVELSDASTTPAGTQAWTISISFDGRRLEQPFTPNLGAAFFSGFHGGNVELTATLKSCDRPVVPCRGDINVTVNARSEGPP